MNRFLLWSAAALLSALASAAIAHEQFMRVTYNVHSDGRADRDVAARVRIDDADDVAIHRERHINFSFTNETAQLLEAYTLKADGRRLDVPPGNLLTRPSADGAFQRYFDWASIRIRYAGLEPGDTVFVRYRIRQTRPVFRGHFSVRQHLARAEPGADVRVILRIPSRMKLRYHASGGKVRTWSGRGVRVLEFRPAGRATFVNASTFASQRQLAEAFGRRASLQAVPAAHIRELVASLVPREAEPFEKARILHTWVSRNIKIAGACMPGGVPVPHETQEVLALGFGACVDHATFLQAMLNAAGIESEIALVPVDGQTQLWQPPVAAQFVHAVVYLPQWDVYADSDARDVPVGHFIPRGAYPKPALHVRNPASVVGRP